MTTREIKREIKKSLDKVPESVLSDILTILKHAEGQSIESIERITNLKKILIEDKKLFEKLSK